MRFYKSSFSNVLKEIFSRDFWVVTSWYQSLGLRDSSTPSGVFELKLRIWEVFSKRVKDFEKKRRAELCVRSVRARTVISQNTLMLCDIDINMMYSHAKVG